MKNLFNPGDKKTYRHQVRAADTAVFESGPVHPVYATFALARDAEWVCRLFVLEMKDEDEEGIGTMVSVYHHAPAAVGQTVEFTAEVISIKDNSILCRYEGKVGERLIASGEQEQKILKKERLARLFQKIPE
ncbi:MAG: hotdog domain-containing protein [Bacteroidia bacterium]